MKNALRVIIISGLVILAAGFVPLTRTAIVTEEKISEVTEYKEEVRTREEPYTEETITGTETREEPLFQKSVFATRGSTAGETFQLKAGDIIKFKAHADGEMMISFTGEGEIYMSLVIGTDIEKEFTIRKDGQHTLLYSSASVTEDITINFDIVRVYTVPIVEKVEKTRTVEYTEKVPYTVKVPVTEETAREEKYTLNFLRYAGTGVITFGLFLLLFERKPEPRGKREKKGKKRKRK